MGSSLEPGDFGKTEPKFNDAAKIAIDFQLKCVFELGNYLVRGISFYLLIFAALFTFVFSQNLDKDVKNGIIYFMIILSIGLTIGTLFLLRIIYVGSRGLKKLLLELPVDQSIKDEIERFLTSGKFSFIGVAITLSIMWAFLVALMLNLLQ